MAQSNDESIFGLLLRAHAQAAAQAHGEEFIHHNYSAMASWKTALQSIESAINNSRFAEMATVREKSEVSRG